MSRLHITTRLQCLRWTGLHISYRHAHLSIRRRRIHKIACQRRAPVEHGRGSTLWWRASLGAEAGTLSHFLSSRRDVQRDRERPLLHDEGPVDFDIGFKNYRVKMRSSFPVPALGQIRAKAEMDRT
jgi:hypothetical protein